MGDILDGIFGTEDDGFFDEEESKQHLRELEEGIDDDAGYVARPEVIDTLRKVKDRDPVHWARIHELLRVKKKLSVVTPLIKDQERKTAGQGGLSTIERAFVNILPSGHKVSPAATIPHGWEALSYRAARQSELPGHVIRRLVSKQRNGNVETMRVPVASSYVAIEAIEVDTITGEAYLEVAWADEAGSWQRTLIPRSSMAAAGGLAKVLGSKRGFPLHPNNARDMAEWLSEYEATNRRHIPVRMVSQQMGWHGNGYLLGDKSFGNTEISFLAPDDGDEQLRHALSQTSGTIQGWLDMAEVASKFPRVELAIYASLCAPLLRILDIPNYIIEWCGNTSSGKSTALSVAASVWGDPSPRSPASVVGSWGSTKIAIERRMSTMSHLPTILDETKMARTYGNHSTVPSIMYAAVNGQSDSRGSVTGLQVSRNWRTVMLSTGEQRMVDFDKSAGTAARVLTLWGSPFGGHQPEAVEALESGFAENYGLAGRMFVQWLIENRGEWEQWREQVKRLRKEIAPEVEKTGNDRGVTNRLANSLAALEMTFRLFHRCFEPEWTGESPVKAIATVVGLESRTAKRQVEAITDITSWVASNLHRVENSERASNDTPSAGWIGYMDDDTSTHHWEWVAIYPSVLNARLRAEGHEPQSIIRQWGDAGWLLTEGGKGRHQKRIKVGKRRVRMVVLSRQALEMAGLGGDTPVDQALPFEP